MVGIYNHRHDAIGLVCNIQLSAGEDTTPTIGSGKECSRNHYTYLLRTQTGFMNLQEYNNESGL